MHSLIVAVSQNIPIIGLSWQPKVHAMFDMIEESDSVFPISDIKKNTPQIQALIEKKLDNEGAKERVEKVNRIIDRQLEINYQIIEEVASNTKK